ncbi:MAG TPA: OmpA family protein [Bacteroidia bacterium]
MKSGISTILAYLTLFTSSLFAQYEANTAVRIEDLVKKIFIGTPEIQVSNVKFKGSRNGLAYFKYPGGGKLGIQEGIFLTTGTAMGSMGPNKSTNNGSDNSAPGDPDLDRLAKTNTYDAVVLEFDFVPVSEWISFRYVFASEEYLEYVNKGYNDVFGFFLSGPGIEKPINMALVPGTRDVVSVNSINNVQNPNFYIDNGSTSDTKTQKVVNKSKIVEPSIEWDGFTRVLTVRQKVEPHQTYHIKLAIADVGDRLVDSGVYLEGKSFKAEGRIIWPPPPKESTQTKPTNTPKRKPLPTELTVEFDFDSWRVPDTSKDNMYVLWNILRDYPHAKFQVYGHTDSFGSNAYNLDLAERRVRSVIGILTKYGCPRSRIIVREALGEEKPKMENSTEFGRARNRRVEIKIRWPKPGEADFQGYK